MYSCVSWEQWCNYPITNQLLAHTENGVEPAPR